jgi:hypothetical protein
MASQELALMSRSGARIIAQPWLEGGPRTDAVAPEGSSIADIIALALPEAPPALIENHVRVVIGETVVPREWWSKVRPKAGAVVVIRVLPGNAGTLRAALSISVGVAALALGQVWAGPLIAGALGFTAGSIGATAVSGLVTATTLLAGTLLVNSLVPLRRDNAASGRAESPTYTPSGFRNVANPDGVLPYVYGKVRFAPPYGALPYTEAVAGETYLRALFILGYGPVKISNIRLGDTPIEKYKEVEIEVREGLPGDTPVTLYPKQVLQEALSVDLNVNYATVFGAHTRFTASDCESAALSFTFPNGLFWMQTSGSPPTTTPNIFTVILRVEYRLNGSGSWTVASDFPVSNFLQKGFSVDIPVTFPARGRYELRVTRLTPDFDDLNAFDPNNQIVSLSIWSGIRSFRPEYPLNFTRPVALIAVKVRGSKQLNGVIDNLNCEVSRVALDWDSGTSAWVERETANAASMLRLSMQGPANAYPLDNDEIDLPGLEDFHEFCTSKNMNFNRVVDYDASIFDVWSEIAASARASVRDDGEKWGVVIDREQTLVMQHFTPRNSWDFSGERQYVRFPDAFRVAFNDETNSHKQAERVVPWPGFVGVPQVTEGISFPGITDPERIYREARRRMYELIHRRDSYSLMTDFEGALARRGDLIRFNHDVLKVTQRAARVRSVEGNIVTLDDAVTMEAGESYIIRFRVPGANDAAPDTSATRAVQTTTGATRALVMTGSGAAPVVGEVVQFGEAGQESIELIVKEVEGAENLARRFVLVPHAPQIHTLADEETVPPWNGRVGEPLPDFFEWGPGEAITWGGELLTWE